MFDKFGEFDSAEELNLAAAGQKEQGDKEALIALAEENGIDKEDAEDYMAGDLEELVTPITAAIGKLAVEAIDVKLVGVHQDWYAYIVALVSDPDHPEIATAVRRKEKSLIGCIGELLRWSWNHMQGVDSRIVKASGYKGSGTVKEGCPDMATAKKIIRDYYK